MSIVYRAVAILLLLSSTATAWAGKARFVRNPDAIPGEYIVIFNDETLDRVNGRFDHAVEAASVELLHRVGGERQARWSNAIRGFAARMTEIQALSLLNDPRVKVVEENARLFLSASQPTPSDLRALDRIDDATADPDFSGQLGDGSYEYSCGGEGIRVYVLDTGIWAAHPEFQTNGVSRVTAGANFAPAEQTTTTVTVNSPDAPCDGSTTYPDGSHGTMVASAIGGNTYGAAKGATLVPVRVVNCTGDVELTHMINGLNWVRQQYDLYPTPAVVNISGGLRLFDALFGQRRPSDGDATFPTGCWSSGVGQPVYEQNSTELNSFELTIENMFYAGITTVVSAGNQRIDARWLSPARFWTAITVGGTHTSGTSDTIWNTGVNNSCILRGSNFGPTVDLFAPAENVRVARYQNATDVISGTSFSAAFVSGVAARFLQGATKVTINAYWPSNVASYLQVNADQAKQTYGTTVSGVPSGTTDRMIWAKSECRNF